MISENVNGIGKMYLLKKADTYLFIWNFYAAQDLYNL